MIVNFIGSRWVGLSFLSRVLFILFMCFILFVFTYFINVAYVVTKVCLDLTYSSR